MKTTAEMIEVMAAYGRGEKIEYSDVLTSSNWTAIKTPGWDWIVYDYRIAKPEPKTVKYLCFEFISTGELVWSREDSSSCVNRMASGMKRIPALDKEVTE
jgi:hypothetical protein